MGYQDFTVKDATSLALGQKGRLTITDTNVHYGRYVALTFLEDTVFDTAGLTDELNQTANGLYFTTGDTTELVAGDFIKGQTSGAIAKVTKVTLVNGEWGTDAEGIIIIEPMTTTGFSAEEDVDTVTIAPVKSDATSYATTVVTEAIVATGTAAAGGVTDGDTQIGETYPAGMTIYGLFTKILLASGALEAYKA